MRRAAIAAVLIGVWVVVWIVWSGAERDGSLHAEGRNQVSAGTPPVLLGSPEAPREPEESERLAAHHAAQVPHDLIRGVVVDELGAPAAGRWDLYETKISEPSD